MTDCSNTWKNKSYLISLRVQGKNARETLLVMKMMNRTCSSKNICVCVRLVVSRLKTRTSFVCFFSFIFLFCGGVSQERCHVWGKHTSGEFGVRFFFRFLYFSECFSCCVSLFTQFTCRDVYVEKMTNDECQVVISMKVLK